MKEWLDRAFLPMITSVVNLRPLTALRNGMTYTIPIIIVGSLFFLFAHFPVDYIAQWIDKTGFSMYFTQVYQATFDVIAFGSFLPLHTLMQKKKTSIAYQSA